MDATEVYWSDEAELYMFRSPFGFDTNHLSGIGFLALMLGVRPVSCQSDGRQEYLSFETGDLRGATYDLRLNLDDFDAEDFLFSVGISSGWVPWMLTCEVADLEGAQGEVALRFDMPSDPGAWTFMGTNPRDQTDADRYKYGALDTALKYGTDLVFLTGVSGDWRQAPEGAFGVREATLRYRNRSVICPSNGAYLMHHSSNGECDPARLTDGNRGRQGDGWYQSGPLSAPIQFIWQLPRAVKISTVVIHQDIAMPVAQCCLILGQKIGETAQLQRSGAMNMTVSEDPESFVAGKVLRISLDQPCDLFGLEILAAASPDGVAIEAIEVFAEDFTPPPSHEPVTVSEEVEGVAPGQPLFYRLVCRGDGEEVRGDVCEAVPPVDETPILHALEIYKVTAEKAVIRFRGNAMGHETKLKWRTGGGGWRTVSFGWERSGADRYVTVRKAGSDDPHHLTAVLVSAMGESDEKSVSWSYPDT